MILSGGLNLDTERNKIRTLFANPAFKADWERILNEIQFNHFQGTKNYKGQWITLTDAFSPEDLEDITDIPVRTINEICEKFYDKYGTDYADAKEFFLLIGDTFRVDLKQSALNNVMSSSVASRVVVPADIEEKRKKLLGYISYNAENRLAQYVDYPIIYKELQTCSPEKVQQFLNFLSAKKEFLIQMYVEEIEECKELLKRGEFLYSRQKFETEQRLEFCQRNYSYYTTVDELEAIGPLVFQSNLDGGNDLTAVFVNKNINEQALASQIKDVQFVNNLCQSIVKGLADQNQYFNGTTIIDRTHGESLSPMEHKCPEFFEEVVEFVRKNQTNFAYDEDIAKAYLETSKHPICGFVKTDADSNKEERFTLYQSVNFDLGEGRAVFPVYLKHVVNDPDSNTISVMMYVFEKPNLALGTQIYRIDKVQPTFRGSTSGHTQSSGDYILTNVHEHLYNLLDRLTLNSGKWRELGHGDVSQNFITDAQIDNDTLELLFNQKCAIEKEPYTMKTVSSAAESERDMS